MSHWLICLSFWQKIAFSWLQTCNDMSISAIQNLVIKGCMCVQSPQSKVLWPKSSNQKHLTKVLWPKFSNQSPQIKNLQPKPSNQKPPTKNLQPKTSNQSPSPKVLQPKSSNQNLHPKDLSLKSSVQRVLWSNASWLIDKQTFEHIKPPCLHGEHFPLTFLVMQYDMRGFYDIPH